MNILEEFYYGNIIPHEIPIVKGSEYEIANKLVVRHDEALTTTLSEQQKEIFEKFKNANLDMLSLGERDAFVRGFAIGVKLITAVMNEDIQTCKICSTYKSREMGCVARFGLTYSYC